MIYLEGKIKTRFYDDKKGIKRYVTEIISDRRCGVELYHVRQTQRTTSLTEINATGCICTDIGSN